MKRLGIVLLALFTASTVYGVSLVTKPYTFTDGTKAEAGKVNSNFDTVYSGANAAIGAINAASGTRPTLDSRMDVSINEDGTMKSNITAGGEWVNPAFSKYSSSTTSRFKILGDQTSIYLAKRRIKAGLVGGPVYTEVSSSSYSAGTGYTTINTADAVLVGAISSMEHAILTPYSATSSLSDNMLNSATANTASTLVRRDASGNFSAGTITAALTGTSTNSLSLGGVLASGYSPVAGPGSSQAFSTGVLTVTQGATTSTLAGNTLSLTSADTDQSHIYFGGATSPQKGAIHYTDNSDIMWFNIASAERMRINSAGNVLIGTTTDNGAKLQVNGNVTATTVTASLVGNASTATNATQLNGQTASYYQPASTAITTSNIAAQSVSTASSATTATNASGTGTLPTTANGENGLRILRGGATSTAVPDAGGGFTVANPASGRYIVTFTTPFLTIPTVTASCTSGTGRFAELTAKAVDSVEIRTFAISGGVAVLSNADFEFIAIGRN